MQGGDATEIGFAEIFELSGVVSDGDKPHQFIRRDLIRRRSDSDVLFHEDRQGAQALALRQAQSVGC